MTAPLWHLGKEWQSRIRRLFETPLDADATPLEICQAALDDVERRVQPIGRGRRVFPYNRIVVRVRQMGVDRPAIESAMRTLDDRIRERLQELRAEVPSTLDVRIAVMRKVPADWTPDQLFAMEYGADAAAAAEPIRSAQPSTVKVTVLKGAATGESYTFNEPTIAIGRSTEPTDELGRVRRNCVAFLDAVDGVTETVGRGHARLRLDPKSGGYRLYDEGSSNGTSIVRDGTTIHVPPRDPQGVRVLTGDEVHVGRAVLRITLEP